MALGCARYRKRISEPLDRKILPQVFARKLHFEAREREPSRFSIYEATQCGWYVQMVTRAARCSAWRCRVM